jgi:uncharacterized protein YbjT (DUF2867 family)
MATRERSAVDLRIELIIQTSFGGDVRYVLEEDLDSGSDTFVIRRHGSLGSPYGTERDQVVELRVSRGEVDRLLSALDAATITPMPGFAAGLDGTTTTLRIIRGANSVEFRWWEDLPEPWAGLEVISEYFQSVCGD